MGLQELGVAEKAELPKGRQHRRRKALAAAKKRGVRLGGRNAQSDATAAEAQARAEALRPLFEELADLSGPACAAALNERGTPTPAGGSKWHAMQVLRVRRRLAP